MAPANDDTDVAYPCVREFAYCGCNKCLPIFNEAATSGFEGSFSSSVETSRPTGLEVQDDQDQKVPNVSQQQTTPPRQNIGTEILARALETIMENPSISLQSDPSQNPSDVLQLIAFAGVPVPQGQGPVSEDLFNEEKWNWKDTIENVKRTWKTAVEEHGTLILEG